MEHPNNPVFEINIDNIESTFDRVKASKNTDELVFVKDGIDFDKAMYSRSALIFLTDSISLYNLNAKKETAIYNSFINDTRLKNIYISLHNNRDHKNLFILLKDILTLHPNLRSLELITAHNGSEIRQTFHRNYCEVFCEGLRHARGLKELTICDRGEFAGDQDKMIQMLTSAIQDNKSLTSLKIRAPLSVTHAIATSLKKNTRIKILQIERLNYSNAPYNISFIKELFEENTTIKSLLFTNIVYTDADVDPFMSLLETTTSLQTLHFPLSNYASNSSGVCYKQPLFNEQIFPKFIRNVNRSDSPLRTLDIFHLVTEDINTLFKSLANNSTLTTLRLGKIEVDDDPNEAEYWSYLYINEDTVSAWNEMLTNNKTLKEISVNGLVCNKEELSRFDNISVDWFKHNKTLMKLDLRANNAIKALLGDALVHNKTLKALQCSRHFMPDPLWQELFTNTILAEIDFSDFYSNSTNDTIKFLQYNTTVQKLTSTLYHYEGDPFLEELANNNSITSYTNVLTAYGINLDYSGKAIAALKNNWTLTDLDLRNNWYKAFYEPILTRNRQFKLSLTLVMHNIVRQKPTMFPMEIWRLIFRHLTPELSILKL